MEVMGHPVLCCVCTEVLFNFRPTTVQYCGCGYVCFKPSDAYQSFIHSPTDAPVSFLKKNNIKIYIKIYIKTAPTCFVVTVTPSSGSALICAY